MKVGLHPVRAMPQIGSFASLALAVGFGLLISACTVGGGGGGGGNTDRVLSSTLSKVEIVSVRDFIADRQDQATLRVIVVDTSGNPAADVEVRLEVTGTDNLLQQPAGRSDASGIAEASLASGKAEIKTISAFLVIDSEEISLQDQPPIQFIGNRVTLSSSLSTVEVNPAGDVLADGQASTQVTVHLVDALGNDLGGESVDIQASGSGNTLDHAGQTNSQGLLTGNLKSTVAESKDITVVVDPQGLQVELDARPSVTFIADAGNFSSSLSTLIADPEFVLRDGVEAATVTVTILDQLGNPVSDQQVFLETTGSSHTLTQPANLTDVNGTATGTLTATQLGEVTVTAKINPATSNVELDTTATVTFVFFPQVTRLARFTTVPSQRIVVPFDQDLKVQPGSASDLHLLSPSDDLGSQVTLGTNLFDKSELVVLLGQTPELQLRGSSRPGQPLTDSPSAIDVSSTMTADVIEGLAGHDAIPSNPVDIVPGFFRRTPYFNDPDTYSVAIGHLNCDGYVDAVAAVNQGGADLVLFNDQAGALQKSQQALGSTSSHHVALADIDGDGDLDIAVASLSLATTPPGGSPNPIWLNDGAGVFSHHQDLGNEATEVLQFGDIDRDGDPDLVTGNTSGQANRVYFNSQGVFTDSGQRWGSDSTEFVVLADVNGDRFLDLIETNGVSQLQTNKVRINDGNGKFNTLSQAINTQDFGRALASGDLNRDGWVDLVFGGQGAQVWLNNGSGTGTFTRIGAVLAADWPVGFLQLVDLDEDGWLDLFVGILGGGDELFWNDGTGKLRGPSEQLGFGCTHGAGFADLDRDGDTDVVVASGGNQANHHFFNTLSLVRRAPKLAATTESLPNVRRGLVIADLDQDGTLDLAGGYGSLASETLGIFLNDGSGGLTETLQNLQAPYIRDLAVADFDLDLDLDLVTAISPNSTVQPFPNKVWFNAGAAQFQESTQSLGDFDNTLAVKAGDLNRDGYPDLVFGERLAIRIWLNDALGSGVPATFTEQPALLGGFGSIDLADMDGDCDLDLVAGQYSADTGLSIWENDGSGSFSLLFSDRGIAARSVLAIDLDLDGVQDLLVSGAFPGNVEASKALLKDSFGPGYSAVFDFGRTDLTFLDVADLDRDGDFDLLLEEAAASSVWYNDGQGSFENPEALSFANGRFGDLDADTDLDIAGARSTALHQ